MITDDNQKLRQLLDMTAALISVDRTPIQCGHTENRPHVRQSLRTLCLRDTLDMASQRGSAAVQDFPALVDLPLPSSNQRLARAGTITVPAERRRFNI